jgi:hypothetical protein
LCLDGELIIPIGGVLSFDALQMRLHPAESRIRKLAAQTPAQLMLFDCLADPEGRSLVERPLSERRQALELFFSRGGGVDAAAVGIHEDRELAQSWLDTGRGFARRSGRQAARRDLRAGRAGDAQDQAVADGRLRRRRLPLCSEEAGGGFAAARALQ